MLDEQWLADVRKYLDDALEHADGLIEKGGRSGLDDGLGDLTPVELGVLESYAAYLRRLREALRTATPKRAVKLVSMDYFRAKMLMQVLEGTRSRFNEHVREDEAGPADAEEDGE